MRLGPYTAHLIVTAQLYSCMWVLGLCIVSYLGEERLHFVLDQLECDLVREKLLVL